VTHTRAKYEGQMSIGWMEQTGGRTNKRDCSMRSLHFPRAVVIGSTTAKKLEGASDRVDTDNRSL